MPDRQTVSKRVKRILGLDVDSWNNVLIGSLSFGALAAVVVGVATFAVIRLQRAEEVAAKAEFERYKLEASERIGTNELKTAESNRRTEELRAENLALEKAVSPRRLFPNRGARRGIPPKGTTEFRAKMAAFPGTGVLIQAVPDFEPSNLALDLENQLLAANWKASQLTEAQTGFRSLLIPEGVTIEVDPMDRNLSDIARSLAESLGDILESKIFVLPRRMNMSLPVPDAAAVPMTSIFVMIGTKPIMSILRDARAMPLLFPTVSRDLTRPPGATSLTSARKSGGGPLKPEDDSTTDCGGGCYLIPVSFPTGRRRTQTGPWQPRNHPPDPV